MKRVVVTGIGLVSPLGIGTHQTWENLLAGKVAIDRVKRFDATGFDVLNRRAKCRLTKSATTFPKSYRKATKVMARDIELAVIAADDAMKDGRPADQGIHRCIADLNSLRFGCNIGAGLISAELDELSACAMDVARSGPDDVLDLGKWGTEGMQQLTPLWLLKYLPNMLACHVTDHSRADGPVEHDHVCRRVSSHLAIGEAYRTIQRGKADLAICGGAETRVNPMGMIRHQLLGRLTTNQPTMQSRPARFAPSTPTRTAASWAKAAGF